MFNDAAVVLAVAGLAAAFVILIPFTTQGVSDPETSSFELTTVLYAANIILASLAQDGTSPQRNKPASRPAAVCTTAMISCPGAIL